MNILDMLTNAQGGSPAMAAGQAVGLEPDQTSSALAALVPALAAGLHRNASQPGGLDALVAALAGGGHSEYLEDPGALARPDTVTDGNAILGHILGSKEASRAVADRAAAQTGISADILKRLLPIAATLVMGSLAKQRSGASSMGMTGGGDIFSMLTPMLDRNGDGSAVDDVLGSIGKMFR
jgi:hypothetical protein